MVFQRICRPFQGLVICLISRYLGLTPQAKYMSRLRRSTANTPSLALNSLRRSFRMAVKNQAPQAIFLSRLRGFLPICRPYFVTIVLSRGAAIDD